MANIARLKLIQFRAGYNLPVIWVEDVESMKQAIEAHGGKYHPGPTAHVPANAEHKFCDPHGIIFDISTRGWDGTQR